MNLLRRQLTQKVSMSVRLVVNQALDPGTLERSRQRPPGVSVGVVCGCFVYNTKKALTD